MREVRPDAWVVIMTAHGTMETAVQAMQHGAYDYLAKPFDLDEVLLLAERALTGGGSTQEVSALRPGSRRSASSARSSAGTRRMQEVYKAIGRVAGSDVTVLLRGETGTGKELVARAHPPHSRRARPALRGASARRSRPRCWSRSCSATRRARSPAPRSGGWASSSWPTAARSSSTRSATCRSSCRPSCCARSRSASSSASAATSRSASTCGCSPRPTATSRRMMHERAASARTCSTA